MVRKNVKEGNPIDDGKNQKVTLDLLQHMHYSDIAQNLPDDFQPNDVLAERRTQKEQLEGAARRKRLQKLARSLCEQRHAPALHPVKQLRHASDRANARAKLAAPQHKTSATRLAVVWPLVRKRVLGEVAVAYTRNPPKNGNNVSTEGEIKREGSRAEEKALP